VTISQAWHTATVTALLNSSCGDLILDKHGDLCTRVRHDWASDDCRDLPWDQHKPGTKLAIITRYGWTLTANGANYILENCSYDKKDRKKLEAVFDGPSLADLIATRFQER